MSTTTLKGRLLYGVLQLEPDEIRHQGAGRFLSRVIESDAVEALALSGRLLALLTGTFAFNLLMGRRWPPRPQDVREAEALCRELGLGELLDRMPAGLMQQVGESAWGLSHGEKSRLYIARALLQGAELVVLDESFAALDPETLRLTLRCVLNHAPTLLVIGHP